MKFIDTFAFLQSLFSENLFRIFLYRIFRMTVQYETKAHMFLEQILEASKSFQISSEPIEINSEKKKKKIVEHLVFLVGSNLLSLLYTVKSKINFYLLPKSGCDLATLANSSKCGELIKWSFPVGDVGYCFCNQRTSFPSVKQHAFMAPIRKRRL